MPVTEETYRRIALEDDEETWELVCGRLRKKPHMTHSHADVAGQLAFILARQLDRRKFRVRQDNSRTQRSESYFVPDVTVVPYELTGPKLGSADDELESYSQALPFVAEVWSKSTGDYDVMTKLPEYRARGDLEIWLIHPYERTVIAWRRNPAGEYDEATYASGLVAMGSLPGVTVDLAELFDY